MKNLHKLWEVTINITILECKFVILDRETKKTVAINITILECK